MATFVAKPSVLIKLIYSKLSIYFIKYQLIIFYAYINKNSHNAVSENSIITLNMLNYLSGLLILKINTELSLYYNIQYIHCMLAFNSKVYLLIP